MTVIHKEETVTVFQDKLGYARKSPLWTFLGTKLTFFIFFVSYFVFHDSFTVRTGVWLLLLWNLETWFLIFDATDVTRTWLELELILANGSFLYPLKGAIIIPKCSILKYSIIVF